MTKKLMVLTLGLVLGAGTSTTAFANNIVCGEECTAQVTIGAQTFTVPVTVDPETGVGTVSNFTARTDDGSTASINNLTLNPDPGIIFGIGVANNSGAPLAFAFAFSSPIALSGTIDAASSIGYTLTDGFPGGLGGAAGVTLAPFNGTHVLVANDFNAFLEPTNKGVDVGPLAVGGTGPECGAFGGATSNCGPFAATNTFSGGPFNTMAATVSFLLTPHDVAGLSGSVSQTPVPEPTTLLFMSAGLLGLAGFAAWQRKQRGSALY